MALGHGIILPRDEGLSTKKRAGQDPAAEEVSERILRLGDACGQHGTVSLGHRSKRAVMTWEV